MSSVNTDARQSVMDRRMMLVALVLWATLGSVLYALLALALAAGMGG